MHIFHSGILGDKGKKTAIPAECGANIILSPINLPPPTTLVAIERIHLPAGAILVSLYEPELFEEFSGDLATTLVRMHALGASANQSVLLIRGDSEGREVHMSPMRIWAQHGGLPWFFPDNLDLYLELQKWEPRKQETTFVDLLATLPGINRWRAEILAETYGVDALKILTLEYDDVAYVLEFDGMEHMTAGDLKKIRHFFGLEADKHLEAASTLAQFLNLAQEVGGKVINE